MEIAAATRRRQAMGNGSNAASIAWRRSGASRRATRLTARATARRLAAGSVRSDFSRVVTPDTDSSPPPVSAVSYPFPEGTGGSGSAGETWQRREGRRWQQAITDKEHVWQSWFPRARKAS